MSSPKQFAPPPRPLAVAIFVIGISGCGGGGETSAPPAPLTRVFTSLMVSPTSATMCTVAPGNAVNLVATPLDQGSLPIVGLANASFTSSNTSVATVDANGRVTALLQGGTQITASLTSSGATRVAVAAITVTSAASGDVSGSIAENHPLPHSAVITAAQLRTGLGRSLGIQGQAMHSHTLVLTDAQIVQIGAGCKTTQASSQDPHSDGTGAHTHIVTFN
jgi:hypothetical protein